MKNIGLKRIGALALTACLAASALAGCSGGAQSGGAAGSAAPSAPQKETLRIGIFAAGREESPSAPGEYIDDNWSTRYIIKNFAEPNNIDLKYEIIDDTNDAGTQNLQTLMASKSAPDLFYVVSGDAGIVAEYAQEGALTDLQPALDKNGSHIKSLIGEDFIKKNGTFSGKLYSIPGKEDIPAISHYWIRQDWLDTLHLSMPANFDEWYSVMKAFKDRASELAAAGRVAKAEDVIPYAMYHTKYYTDWERIVTRFYPTEFFDPKKASYYIDSGYGTEYLKTGFKDGMQFMNQMYNEGLISKNFALDTDDKQFQRDIVSGNAGSYCDNLFNGWGPSDPESWQSLLAKNIPGAKFEFVNPFTNKYDGVARNPLDNPVLTYVMVPSFSKSADAAVKYLDYVSVPDNLVTIQYGEKDVSYIVDPVLGPMLKDDDALKAWGHMLGGRELVMLKRLPDAKWARIQRSGAKTADEAAYAEKIHQAIEENGYERFPGVLAESDVKSQMENLRTPWQQFVSDLIMAKPGQFDAAWTKGTKELEANGSLTVVEGYKKTVKEQLGIE